MARPSKKIDADALVGEIALMRSPIWQNGKRKVAAIITEATTDEALLPENAIALVSLTAFPADAPSRVMVDVPLYRTDPDADVFSSAWLKTARA
ncbi:hypothetical protein PPGU19_011900 [Paraburkholderia sp. PGU19]|uniref:hypothetical protein n=1 Tax=Paraburkholderia sp. PGU19 TaxID=2735434 RepID=UPI0015DB6E64|nr:hypothetical protein [Paraburkholderia sp. PGU19]BCF96621.1 hypothetical protein PPGU19_011900 [Paraburkholderia sp. PGU19]